VKLLQGDCIDILKTLEDNSIDAIVTDLQIGKAGEYLVCADLILKGYVAYPSEQGLPYDVVADLDDRLIKIQVKTTRSVRPIPQRKKYTPAYLFHITRCGKHGKKKYSDKDFDVMALVALDTRKIAYIKMSEARKTIHLSKDKFNSLNDIRRII
jgi:hypothetical protein